MKTLHHPVKNKPTTIRVVENPEDLESFYKWLPPKGYAIALDTETTGLGIHTPGFKIRTVQVALGREAWVIPTHIHNSIDYLDGYTLIIHNAAYDLLAIRQHFGKHIPWSQVVDTKILAHLVDSRSSKEGGSGHSLQELTAYYLDEKVADEVKGSITRMCKEQGLKKGDLFAKIPVDNETYLLYAGMDPILTYGLYHALPKQNDKLARVEHRVAEVCAEMEATGFLLDTRYTQNLSEKLKQEEEAWGAIALAEYGTESVNSTQQVAADLIASGVELTERTNNGGYKLDKHVLEPLVREGHRLAVAVTEAKKARKWRTSWVDKFLDLKDSSNRCHANIHPLQARTGRMSVTGIPAQTLPSSDWVIRRCFIPDPGETLVSCDYQAQELRVLAALSGDPTMKQAFEEGADLHQLTADASGVDRATGKTVNFAYVYGSGPFNIAETCGITIAKAKQVIQGFEDTYPRVKELSTRLQNEAIKTGRIITPSGRMLYIDASRPYSALNYMIQSTSRDITCAALLRLHNAGYTKNLRLPIHDEVIASVPAAEAEYHAQKIASIMKTRFNGVLIDTDAAILGNSWGAGYVPEEEQDEYDSTFLPQ